MSKEFIESGVNSSSLRQARRQQEQLLYFTKSSIQEDVTLSYLEEWQNRNFDTDVNYLNWVRTILKTDNFLSVFKYMRFPLSSASLVNDSIKPALDRVLYAEDSYFKYIIDGEYFNEVEDLRNDILSEEFLDKLIFRTNDVYITDLKDINDSFCFTISIKDIVALDHDCRNITKIAFKAVVKDEKGEDMAGYAYIDDTEYAFYDSEKNLIKSESHDLGVCPATFIGSKTLDDDFIIKENTFSYLLRDLEQLVFLKTLQKMSETNGAFPISVSLDVKERKLGGSNQKLSSNSQPLAQNLIGGQSPKRKVEVAPVGSPSQAGTTLRVKPNDISDAEGKINMDILKNYITYFHIPVDILTFINTRVKELETYIVSKAIGTYTESSQEGSKSDLHLSKAYVSMEDRLRSVSQQLTTLRKNVDIFRLGLKHGKENVQVDIFYGSKFFLETNSDLYTLFEKSMNPIERKNILIKLTRNNNKFNPDKAKKDIILYDILPYSADIDFDKAIERGIVTDQIFQLQTRFPYWIGRFESTYGDILLFWKGMGNKPNSEKINDITNLLIKIIKDEQE